MRSFWLALLGVTTWVSAANSETLRVYIGTYTRGTSRGIYVCELDRTSGELTRPRLAAEAANPSFLAVHPSGKFLVAVNELPGKGPRQGGVSSFRIDPATGKLTRIDSQSSQGAGPCHLVVDATGQAIVAANYGGGSTVVVKIDPATGELSPASALVQHRGRSVHPRQKAPHAHGVALSPDGGIALVADLGLDRILIYDFDARRGVITAHDPPFAELPPASGPRHVVFHPSGRWVYSVNELASTVTGFAFDRKSGSLKRVEQVTTLPAEFSGSNTTAEIAVTSDGRFLYASNRGHDSLACFAVDGKTGRLTPLGHCSTQGKTPRNFAIDPTGRFVLAANQATGDIAVLRIEPNGTLEPTGHRIEVGAPVCIVFWKKP